PGVGKDISSGGWDVATRMVGDGVGVSWKMIGVEVVTATTGLDMSVAAAGVGVKLFWHATRTVKPTNNEIPISRKRFVLMAKLE
ncbi:MAG: hypothetical protein ABSA51_12535, partial [Anaerolineaceae bacterium]